MSQPSGTHASTCRYCGNRYQLTNWMKRKNLGRDDEGRLLGDTHQAACWRKLKVATIEISQLNSQLTNTPERSQNANDYS